MPDPVRDLRHELISVGLMGAVETKGIVNDVILRSWRRSISVEVPRDVPTERFAEIDTDSILCRAAAPIFDRWQEQLADTGAALLLSDRGGSIVMRRATDSRVLRSLDRANAAEGFNYSEEQVGTNGIGTAIAERNSVFVVGSEHFNDILSGLTCAAVPVSAPGGTIMGAVSISAQRDSTDPLMVTLTREIGRQIEERLKATSRPEDLALAMSFMRHANAEHPIVVMDRQSLLANTPGLSYVDATSHVVLWDMLNAHDWSRGQLSLSSYGPSNADVAVQRLVGGAGEHFVLRFREAGVREDRREPVRRRELGHKSAALNMVSLVEGPSGTGRATVARQRVSGMKFIELCASGETPWLELEAQLTAGTSVVLRCIDLLPDGEAVLLEHLIRVHQNAVFAGQRDARLVITVDGKATSSALSSILTIIPDSVSLPPLVETPERIPGLVREVLERVDSHSRHSVSPAALQSLMQWNWPGNITELVEVVVGLVERVAEPVIQRRHLPDYLNMAPPRRRMSMLETAERDAIVRALTAANGNKSEAAQLLGIGRTTLYRRLKYFKLDASERSL